eukprot:352213-Chlamydomonas_euryale.AAC.2
MSLASTQGVPLDMSCLLALAVDASSSSHLLPLLVLTLVPTQGVPLDAALLALAAGVAADARRWRGVAEVLTIAHETLASAAAATHAGGMPWSGGGRGGGGGGGGEALLLPPRTLLSLLRRMAGDGEWQYVLSALKAWLACAAAASPPQQQQQFQQPPTKQQLWTPADAQAIDPDGGIASAMASATAASPHSTVVADAPPTASLLGAGNGMPARASVEPHMWLAAHDQQGGVPRTPLGQAHLPPSPRCAAAAALLEDWAGGGDGGGCLSHCPAMRALLTLLRVRARGHNRAQDLTLEPLPRVRARGHNRVQLLRVRARGHNRVQG